MTRPTLLLHSCCGPCSTAVLETLLPNYAVTLYFYNPNLNSEAEYMRRLKAQETVAEHFSVELITAPYEPASFVAATSGLEDAPEGGARCVCCFTERLEETVQKAKALGFSMFGTTLSVSPHKDADLLNEIGSGLGVQHALPYLAADFKQKEGYRRSAAIARSLALYRQNYCGCQYSLR